MPRYFFHIHDGISLPDEEGTELANIYDARQWAVRRLGDQLCELGSRFWHEMGARFWDGTEWKMEVTDKSGEVLFVLRFSAEELRAPPRLQLVPQPSSTAQEGLGS